MIFTEKIIPYVGTESIALYRPLDEVRGILREAHVQFHEEIWSNKENSIPNPWTVLKIDDVMTLYFAKNNKLFKIMLWKDYQGCLPNGIHTRMPLQKAQQIDPDLVFDDWNEDFESPAGYWVEDDIDTGEIDNISIFIKEVLDEDHFDYCNW